MGKGDKNEIKNEKYRNCYTIKSTKGYRCKPVHKTVESLSGMVVNAIMFMDTFAGSKHLFKNTIKNSM